MSPHTRFIPLAVGALLLTAACGAHDETPPVALPSAALPSAPSPLPSFALPPPTFTPVSPGGVPTTTWVPPTYAYPTGTTPTATATSSPTAAPLTKSPTPTPAHAAKCSGEPTGAQILTLVKGHDGIPNKTLQVQDGPFCADTWSFTVLRLAGAGTDDQEPLNVVASGAGSSLTFITAGSDVCNPQVQTSAPAGIRVLACGF
ncbi:hypothetical protein [Actinoplanes sp. NPDC020271]|uniref:hypothetical protein n=1 Tax=Actinoplanes sp. NPDC020271 TaxID=3363896 RepID=UPI0037A64F88